MSVTRRSMLASAALAGVASAVPATADALPASVMPSAPDAGLLWLCAEFSRVNVALNAIPGEDDDSFSAEMDVRNALAERIGLTHPVSALGLQAKARVGVLLLTEGYPQDVDRDDVVGFAGDFMEGLSGMAINFDPGASPPDAELLAACAVFDTLEHQVDALYAGSGRIEDDDELQTAINAVADRQKPWFERICDLRAVTPAGWKAKARSFAAWDKEELRTKLSEGDTSERILSTLLRDMLA